VPGAETEVRTVKVEEVDLLVSYYGVRQKVDRKGPGDVCVMDSEGEECIGDRILDFFL
jgi:hypothetical protein